MSVLLSLYFKEARISSALELLFVTTLLAVAEIVRGNGMFTLVNVAIITKVQATIMKSQLFCFI